MKSILANNKQHLKDLIQKEYELNGDNCYLNHIDVSNITDMSYLFQYSILNADISKWDVSNVKNMSGMFAYSQFTGDISRWNTSNVEIMGEMFYKSKFNGDISNWNTSMVENMLWMFRDSEFKQDLSNWDTSNVNSFTYMFLNCCSPIPYWAGIEDKAERQKAIESYRLNKALSQELDKKDIIKKKVKI